MAASSSSRNVVTVVMAIGALAIVACVAVVPLLPRAAATTSAAASQTSKASPSTGSSPSIELSSNQLSAIRVEPVGAYLFSVQKDAVGNIDFDEDLAVQVFPPYQGKILKTFAELGDDVKKGNPLYTIDSPDLIQAESTLIAAAATFDLTMHELTRVKNLYNSDGTNGGIAQKDLEQAISDQLSAEGALRAARDAVRVFGKTEADVDRLLASRKIDPTLVVTSPEDGRIISRNAQLGLLVQPGNTPAPYSVADLSLKWMMASISEGQSPLFHIGQAVKVTVLAYPDRVFEGRVTRIGSTVDANTHRISIRSEIADAKNELLPGMLASFVIEVQDAVEATAIPLNGVVHESDGTLTAWVTADRHRFSQRQIKIGLQKDGRYQVLDGLSRGELAVTDGAVFLSNILNAPPDD